ncbi:MAG: translation initiation factor IF-2 [Anaerolineae bacterium]|nr:translation initiation factor IF-2 [Anaerolineae bacterium]MDW8171490.1 translation initiation factor IF-2 [Anaerolineae bacterium]
MAQEKQAIIVPDYLTVRELAELIKASPIEVMKKLIASGIMASINQQIDFDTAAIVVSEFGYEAVSKTALAQQQAQQARAEQLTRKYQEVYADEDPKDLKPRPPIVAILGHVDHGKTTLLDTIRSTNVAAGEAGGITQHIGAYRVKHNNRSITFLDTPGHEAFTQMRARGAQGADIAVLVVAADDGVMPTTREAINHARAANVPIVVAITKIDKSNANVERVKQQLAELELVADDWDGDTLMVPVAAIKKQGIEDLLEAILLTADSHNFVANPKGTPRGVVIESQVDRNRGTMATLLVMNGTLKVGDVVVVGVSYGRIKAMYDEFGKPIKEAPPSTPVSVLGLSSPPQPGERFQVVKNDREARALVEERQEAQRSSVKTTARSFTLEDVYAHFQTGQTKELNLIIKVDVNGSLQPIVDSLKQLSDSNKDGIKIRILAADVGNLTENDIMLASTSHAIVIGFNVEPSAATRSAAAMYNVEIRYYDVIYKLLEDMELALKGMLEPQYQAKTIGVAEVRQLFKISKVGTIAGSYVREGEARRNAKVRVRRGKELLLDNGSLISLKRFNEDVREVRTGFECGVSIEGFNDLQEGDLIEFFVMERVN